MSYKPLTGMTAATAAAALSALALTILPAQADSTRSTTCVGFWAGSCVTTWRHGTGDPHIRYVPAPLSDADMAESRHREQLWLTLCQPEVRQDRYGVERYVYAAAGCEYGRYR